MLQLQSFPMPEVLCDLVAKEIRYLDDRLEDTDLSLHRAIELSEKRGRLLQMMDLHVGAGGQ